MSSERVFNFSAGPTCMPEEVLATAAGEMSNWQGKAGMGVAEMSHRSKEFMQIVNELYADTRELLQVPDNYKIMFLQGGATGQFAGVPLNLLNLGEHKKASYVVTGTWGDKAFKEAQKYGTASLAANAKSTKYTVVPAQDTWEVDKEASYLHYCDNETVNGVEFSFTPDVDVPLVADMSSNFMSRPIDFNKHVAVYAGAQKNAGPAGVTVVIAREDVLGKQLDICPTILNWKEYAASDSLYNTPPCYAMYMCGLFAKWTKQKGGLAYWDELSKKKSGMVYDVINGSDGFYSCPVQEGSRSRMNIPFIIKGGDEALEKKFLEEAKKIKLFTLAGHRSVGGLRASLYNAMPMEGVDTLAEFMKSFMSENAA